eukprot:TRINITY_DN26781_c0_g1_i1.p1 TRINITY_DN26781_c0_g1~~TRINITY_DN26781_c0_g1_i1.p1  ORF type:complete len:471 (+),score=91.39 TRINITY_DN26781_c0_g1_i1:42-1454(+)
MVLLFQQAPSNCNEAYSFGCPDGRPMTPNPKRGEDPDVPRGKIGTADAVAAAKLVKSSSNATTLVGVMVGMAGATEQDLGTLRALSSCCGAENTSVSSVSPEAAVCLEPVSKTCPYTILVSDFDELLNQVKAVVDTVARLETVVCEELVEETRRRSLRSHLWWLLLPLPAAAVLLAALLASQCRVLKTAKPALTPPVVDVVEMSAPTSAASDPPSTSVPAAPAAETLVPAAPTPENPKRLAVTPLLLPPRAGDPEAGGGSPTSDSGRLSSLPSPGSAKKWSPVRHAYMVNGRPVVVNYGTRRDGSRVVPPTAPTRARHGYDTLEADRFFKPEAALEHQEQLERASQASASERRDTATALSSEASSPAKRRNTAASSTAAPTLMEEPASFQLPPAATGTVDCETPAAATLAGVSMLSVTSAASSAPSEAAESPGPRRRKRFDPCGPAALVLYAVAGTLAMLPAVIFLTTEA